MRKRDVINLFLEKKVTSLVIAEILRIEGIIKLNEKELRSLRLAVTSLHSKFKTKFKAEKIAKDKFYAKHADWLDSKFNIPHLISKKKVSKNKICVTNVAGRPPLSFDGKSDRSKRREVAALSLQNNYNPHKLLLAASHAAKKSGENDMSACVRAVLHSPERPKKIKKILDNNINITKKSSEEALAFLLLNNLSKQLYINMRLECKKSGADIWPPYTIVSNAKNNLRPPKEVIAVSENVAEILVQELLNLTIKRIVELQRGVLLQYVQTANKCVGDKVEMVLMSSWGFEFHRQLNSFSC